MTDERKTTGSSTVDDGLVSEAYRESATERAPEHLNVAVLKTAAEAARPRYSLLRTWTRPVAWAAVVMLSFALVLELTQTPVPDPADEVPAAPATLAAPDAERRMDRQLSEFEALDDDGTAGLAKRERVEDDVQELKVMDADLLQRAEEMARTQQGARDEPVPAAAEPVLGEGAAAQAVMPLPEKSSLRSAAAPVEMESGCDESARAEPEDWLACIVALEESGLTEIADAERELLRAAFPGFTE